MLTNIAQLLPFIAIAAVVYAIAVVLHRLFFCRIAHIPGPRLAAVTYFYQYYYDFFPHAGRFTWHLRELHDKYGPIVRIGPDEVHIHDIAFYNEIYPNASRPRDKSRLWFWNAGNPEFSGLSTFLTMDHDVHRMRRGAFGQYFSRQRVLAMQPSINEKVERLRDSFLKRKPDDLVQLTDACGALTLEVITEYTFGEAVPVLQEHDYAAKWNEFMRDGPRMNALGRAFPTLMSTMLRLPTWMLAGSDGAKLFLDFFGRVDRLTEKAFESGKNSEKHGADDHITVLHEMLHSDLLPPEDKEFKRMSSDASIFIGAGMETTGRTLAVTLFHILANKDVYDRLREELRPLIPSSDAPLPSVAELERLPYLTAVLTEGLRIGHGVAARLVRIAPAEDLNYHGIVIPRGTTMGQSNYLLHTDRKAFPNPLEFHPERFLGPSAAEAHRHMVPFGKGPRSCVGMNLAWAELYLTVASLIAQVKMELVDTTIHDATVQTEYFIGCLPLDSKGIRVRILGAA